LSAILTASKKHKHKFFNFDKLYLWISHLHPRILNMTDIIFNLLFPLESAFTRTRTFLWFGAAVVGLAAGRDDIGGVSCITRNLRMSSKGYEALLRFFSSTGVRLEEICQLWLSHAIGILFKDQIVKIANRMVLIIDGTAVAKRAKCMPELRKHYGSTTKGLVKGHFFECLCLLVSGTKSLFSVPVAITMLTRGLDDESSPETMIDKVGKFITSFPILHGSIVVADAWYTTSKLIMLLAKTRSICLISRVARNVVAKKPYIPSPIEPVRRGRKRTKSKESIKVSQFFNGPLVEFKVPTPQGGIDTVMGWCEDLYWPAAKKVVRFVGVCVDDKPFWTLMCSDTELAPEDIILAYRRRFMIEQSFRTAKSLIGSFSYRFWMKIREIPFFEKKTKVLDYSKNAIAAWKQKVQSIQLYAICAMIAQGALVYISLNHGQKATRFSMYWMRTVRNSEGCERRASAAIANSLLNLRKAGTSWSSFNQFMHKYQDNDYLHQDFYQSDTA
jgi:hypothetical protein